MRATWRRRRERFALFALLALGQGCKGPPPLAPAPPGPPPPPLRAAKVSAQAVEVEIAEPLDRASAEEVGRYVLHPDGSPGAPLSVTRATLVDTIFGRAVQLVLAGPLPDGSVFVIEASDVRTLDGESTGRRVATFRSGLNYAEPMRDLFAQHCNSCHGDARLEGNYRTDSPAALTGGGTNTVPNLIAGNLNCLLVVKTRPGKSMFAAGALSWLDADLVRSWVVNYQARP